MCKASIEARLTRPAVVGQTYGIGISAHGLGALHPVGETTATCVVCVQDGAQLTLSNIPEDLQREFGITDLETATFVDTGDNRYDYFDFGSADTPKMVGVHEFADRDVIAYVGVVDVTIPADHTGVGFNADSEQRELEDA